VSAPTLFNPERPAATTAAGARPYVITLPAGIRLLNSNQRRHRHEQARIIAKLRETAFEAVSESPSLMDALAAAKPGPLFQRAHILGVLHPASKTRCDPANWYPSFKAAVDGLVDAGLFDDDDHTRVVGPDMRLGRVVKKGQLVLVVSGLEPGEDPLGYQAVTR
jgi:crossover junction endodeoxyribonuclease RusA